MAALRMVARACGGGEAVQVAAHGAHASPALSNPDSICGVIRFDSGLPATVSISLAASQVGVVNRVTTAPIG